DINEFCGLKGIKREYSNARTPQQNGVAERKNRTLIEAARTMLADSFLPNTFWAETVSTACYVLNRVLVTKPHNKTPYELLTGKTPIISYIRHFGCHVTILNTIDHLGKFAGKFDECKKANHCGHFYNRSRICCCGQVLWIQNQMLDYGFNFMNTKIYIDNESTICIVKNPVYHSKTKHIAIRHHFIRDAYEKKLIQVLKIHTNDNVADLLTKAFDVSRFQFLVVSIGMNKTALSKDETPRQYEVLLSSFFYCELLSFLLLKLLSKKSKNSLVKHFEDMRLCRPSKEYLQVKLVSMLDDEGRSRYAFHIIN
ncbi:retrovirus-related pol polyprotein from transposon TNT 1-94, partial [Tanacetum coccineum]